MEFFNEVRKKTLAYNESMGKLNECKTKIKSNLDMLHEKCKTSQDEKQLIEMLSDLDEMCTKHLTESIQGTPEDFKKEFDNLYSKFEQKIIQENPELENNKKSVLIKVINEFKLKRSKMNTFFKEANKDYFDAFQKYIVSLESEYEKFKPIKEAIDSKSEAYAVTLINQLRTGGLNSPWAYFGMNSPLVDGYRKGMDLEEYKKGRKEEPEFHTIQQLKGYDVKLSVKASGSKYQRGIKVAISLNFKDLYDVVVYQISNNATKVKVIAEVEDIYSDMVFSTLKKILG